MTGFFNEFSDGAGAVHPGDIFSGKLNFSAENSRAKGVINLKIDSAEPPQSFLDVFDEAYLRAYFGKFDIEAALNITEDLDGDKPDVYNPSFAWSLGFDRDLFWGINLNAQCNETVRLFDGEIKDPPAFDIESGSAVTATTLTAALSKKFLRDELELKAAVKYKF